MWFQLLVVLFVFLVLLVYLTSPDRRTAALASNIPGPTAYPIIGNLYYIPPNGREGIKKRKEMIEEFGHVCKIWMGPVLVVMISEPRDVEVILSSTVHIEKSSQYDCLHPWLGTGLLTSSGEKWFLRRKAITPTFHFKILEQFVDVFNKNGDILVKRLRSAVNQTPFLDIRPFISTYALDVICESAMGTEINAQLDSSSEYVEAVRRLCEVIYKRLFRPWLRLDLVFALSGGLALQTRCLKVVHDFTNKVIEEKRKWLQERKANTDGIDKDDFGVKRKTPFLELLLKMSEDPKGTFISNNDIREEVDTFMFEGHDTTTSSLCYTLYLLGKHPQIQEKIYEELQSFELNKREATMQNLQDMKYLERVIKESLRLYPAVPVIMRKIKSDLKLASGYTLPRGCMVGVSAFFTHRNKEHYNQPEIFNPDNFLPEVTPTRHPYAYIPFSAGPRNCIGQKFAMLELKATLVKLLTEFRVETAGVGWDCEIDPSLTLQSANGFHIRLYTRS